MALTITILIALLTSGCMQVIAALQVLRSADPPMHAMEDMLVLAAEVCDELRTGRRRGNPLPMRLPEGVILVDSVTRVDAIELPLSACLSVPVNPAISSDLILRQVHEERTGSAGRADRFVSRIQAVASSGDILTEDHIRLAAGSDYPLIVGLITAEPVLNVNAVPADLLRDLVTRVSTLLNTQSDSDPNDVDRALMWLCEELVSRRGPSDNRGTGLSGVQTRDVELSELIRRASAMAPDHPLLPQKLHALLGTRTWFWNLYVTRPSWQGLARIAFLPGHTTPSILGVEIHSCRDP